MGAFALLCMLKRKVEKQLDRVEGPFDDKHTGVFVYSFEKNLEYLLTEL